MSERVCVAGCRVTGKHYASCSSATCRGCVGREAKVGFLCDHCWLRLEQQLADWPIFAGAIVAFGRLVQRERDGGRSTPDGYVPLTQTFMDVDEAESWMQPNSGWYGLADADGDARRWVSTQAGAKNAVEFTRCAERCRRSHQVAEKDGKLRKWRCPNCHQTNPHELTLWLKQPRWAGDDRVIRCMNGCGYEVSMDHVSVIADVEAVR